MADFKELKCVRARVLASQRRLLKSTVHRALYCVLCIVLWSVLFTVFCTVLCTVLSSASADVLVCPPCRPWSDRSNCRFRPACRFDRSQPRPDHWAYTHTTRGTAGIQWSNRVTILFIYPVSCNYIYCYTTIKL